MKQFLTQKNSVLQAHSGASYGGGRPGTLKEAVESDHGGGEGQSRGGEASAF